MAQENTARREYLTQLARFCTVGASGVGVNLLVMWGAILAGFPLLGASALAFLVACSTNYILNRCWTFHKPASGGENEVKPTPGGLAGQWARFVTVSLAGLGANLLVLWIAAEGLGMWYIIGQLAGIGAGTNLNFALSRALVFGHQGIRGTAGQGIKG